MENIQALTLHFINGKKLSYEGTQRECQDVAEDFTWQFSRLKLMNLWNSSSYIKRSGILAPQWYPKEQVSHWYIRPVLNGLSGQDMPAKVSKQEIKPILKPQPVNGQAYEPRVSFSKNKDHISLGITLHASCNVTCVETGISYEVALPSVIDLNLATLHPFSFFSNVDTFIRSYESKGLSLEKYIDKQVICGMLITCLRHHKLIHSTDYVSANLFLQKADLSILTSMLRYFVFLRSSINMTHIRLIPESIYSIDFIPEGYKSKEEYISDRVNVLLINYFKLCKGEGGYDSKHSALVKPKPKSKGTIRIYGGNLSIEKRQADANQASAYRVFEKLCIENPDMPETLQDYIENKIDAFLFLDTSGREQIAREILTKFGQDNKTAVELSSLFTKAKTETIELGLTGFSDYLEKEIKEFQTEKRKFNLLSKIKKD